MTIRARLAAAAVLVLLEDGHWHDGRHGHEDCAARAEGDA